MERARELNQILTEAAAENDESLMELYFDKGVLDAGRNAFGAENSGHKRDLVPGVLRFGQTRYRGRNWLMEFIINVAPGPIKAPAFRNVDGGEVPADSKAPTALFVFKKRRRTASWRDDLLPGGFGSGGRRLWNWINSENGK